MDVTHVGSGQRRVFEISERVNHSGQMWDFMNRLIQHGAEMLGFNNEHYDYELIHMAYNMIAAKGIVTPYELYQKSQAIFDTPRGDWSNSTPPWKRVVKQIDVFKIMHFDNFARATSLKALQIAMRSKTVEDLPIPPGTIIDEPDIDRLLIPYMCHDVSETIKFAKIIEPDIKFRRELSETSGIDMMNFNDTRIGKQTFISELENHGIECFTRETGRKRPRQTRRDAGIVVANKLLPVRFQSGDLSRIWDLFSKATIPAYETKGFFKDLSAPCGDLDLHFGSGGLHGSVSGLKFEETKTHEIVDIDVVSFYPSLAIVNRWYPEHLTETFCDIYDELKARRVSYAKGTAENNALKLALNGVYGDSNNEHSPFYDPAYTMAITINGQMLLASLAEALSDIKGVKLIQVNTDGVTLYAPRTVRSLIDVTCKSWEQRTRLDLEYVNYRLMAVRDVNNYIAVGTDDKVKRVGAYMTEPPHKRKPVGWHQDLSSMVVPMAASAALIDGTDIQEFVYGHTDKFDFMRRIKVPKKYRLVLETPDGDETPLQHTSRYFIALGGHSLTKIMPPLAGKTVERRNAVDKGWLVQECNDADNFDWNNLNRRFYVMEAKKLVDPIRLYTDED